MPFLKGKTVGEEEGETLIAIEAIDVADYHMTDADDEGRGTVRIPILALTLRGGKIRTYQAQDAIANWAILNARVDKAKPL